MIRWALCFYLVFGNGPIPWVIGLPLCPFILWVGRAMEMTADEWDRTLARSAGQDQVR